MSYDQFAYREFRAAGWVDENNNFNDEMQESICRHVLALLDVFSSEGHSGSSAPYAIDLFKTLASYEPIVPLTGEDWEWNHIQDDRTGNNPVYQNKRCSHVFKQADRFDGQAYDIDGKIFWEWYRGEDGVPFKSYYTGRESAVPVTFPYTPKREYVWKWSDAEPRTPPQTEEGFI